MALVYMRLVLPFQEDAYNLQLISTGMNKAALYNIRVPDITLLLLSCVVSATNPSNDKILGSLSLYKLVLVRVLKENHATLLCISIIFQWF